MICTKCDVDKPIRSFATVVRNDNGKERTFKQCRDCQRETARISAIEYRKKNPLSQSRERHIAYKYGLSIARYEEMLREQDGKCAICRTVDWSGKYGAPHIDHCHETGNVRALLCAKCNIGLGSFRDDPDIMRRAADYLERHR